MAKTPKGLVYLTEKGKIHLSNSRFSNQPKSSPFANLYVHAHKPFSLPRKKEKRNPGAYIP